MTLSEPDDYAVGVSDIIQGPFGQGFGAAVFGHFADSNPFPTDTNDWREWKRGHEAAQTVEWKSIEIPDDSPIAAFLPAPRPKENVS
jgi:hypothetical protein